MVNYLLGELSDDRQTEFETRYLADQSLFEQMLLVKKELVDAYVRQHLDAESRGKFERHFLTTPEGQKEVAFARALREKLNEPASPIPAKAQTSFWQTWFASWTLREIGLAAAALLLLMIGLGWLGRENQKLRRELSAMQTERAQQAQREKELTEQLAAVRAQSPNPTPAPVKPPPELLPPAGDLFAINLPSPSRASGVQVIRLSTGMHHPRLNLQLDFEPVALRCDVSLRTPDGVIIERRNLRALRGPQDRYVIRADFPATTLKAGDYEVTATGRDAENKEPTTHTYKSHVATASQR